MERLYNFLFANISKKAQVNTKIKGITNLRDDATAEFKFCYLHQVENNPPFFCTFALFLECQKKEKKTKVKV